MLLPRSTPRRLAVCLGVLAALLGAPAARAYCPEVTEDPPSGYDPAKQGCFSADPGTGATLPTLFWRGQCVGYSLQRGASSQISLTAAATVAAQAFATWSAAPCAGGAPSITAIALPPVDCDVVPSQGHNNVIIFRDGTWPYNDSANALGITKLTVNKTTGEIYGADIEINSTKILVAQPPAPQGAYDLATIMTHETGHFLGLAHSTDTSAVMYAFYHAGSTTLALDDVAGICSTYAPGGTRATRGGPIAGASCDPTPHDGFSSSCDGSDAGAGDAAVVIPGADPGFDAGDNSNIGPCEVGLFSCAVGAGRSLDGAPLAMAFAVVACGVVARRSRRRSSVQDGRAPLAILSEGILRFAQDDRSQRRH